MEVKNSRAHSSSCQVIDALAEIDRALGALADAFPCLPEGKTTDDRSTGMLNLDLTNSLSARNHGSAP